jgi:hypothetical protein
MKQFCILGQLDHGKAIDRFTVKRLGKREYASEERRCDGQYWLMYTEVDKVGRSNDNIRVGYVQGLKRCGRIDLGLRILSLLYE